ncbi:hypothetical protein BGZ65_004523 [Modicella reniformis]|uniref:Uncharacterized protein n=1 Tax=Modicella reniformis TaxID=1440133 RepID=A0A9P6IYE9_9FUNG|nr:hypothetical protein BGZ65_004523 [Modicella reniformis]
MAVTTRKRAAPATPETPAKRATPARRKTATKRSKKAVEEPESEEQVDHEDEQEEREDKDNDAREEEKDAEESEIVQDDSSDEETFKIHTPKASAEPKIAPAALPTRKYEDEGDEDDSDAAPEAESLSSAKTKALNAQDKEKSFLSKIQAEQKAKRIEREEKLKVQKEQARMKTEAKAKVQEKEADEKLGDEEEPKPTTKSGLPEVLPMDILESVVQMEDSQKSSDARGSLQTGTGKKKHMRPEDFALMKLEEELKAVAQRRKKEEKTQKNIGPVTVKVLDQSHLAKPHAVPETIVDFRKQHFYGSKIQRKDAVLNLSQRNIGAASKFHRRK